MLTALHLENFKGFSDRQSIDLAPLTLLFGPNSAGKSTILQAILYLHELVVHGTANVDRTDHGGSTLELGGFDRLVHRHETHRSIVLRAEFTTPRSLERFGRNLDRFPFPNLDDDLGAAWLELTIRKRTTAAFHGPLIDRAVIGVVGSPVPLVWLETGATLRAHEPLRARINLGHPILAHAGPEVAEAWSALALPEPDLVPTEPSSLDSDDPTEGHAPLTNRGLGFDDRHPLPVFALANNRPCALPALDEPLRVLVPQGGDPPTTAIADEIRTFLEMVVLGTAHQLVTALQSTHYIGPLRTIPVRGFLHERPGRTTGWADGLAAWDLLLARGSEDLVRRTNAWLRRLGTGCQVVVQELLDPNADATGSRNNVDGAVRRLLLETEAGSRVLPSEVGSGVSQVLPIVVAALHARAGLIEQPELHVHPAIQVGLGDLFIEAALRDGGQGPMMIETHSEHLILRVLRRIRQTTDGELPDGSPGFSPDQLSVSCVEQGPFGTRIYRRHATADGDWSERWPSGFFPERREEVL
ncbi:AAA family ATPase [Paraliomyxa miuraensis]|uniref:AAA family ATPase n=1 Tax=Paraliomyxa miuraensis TaxID=376150 RepID=UPI00224F171F|nr:AAA family ATPase [Paraliomyxa miuraensis]MCX4246618.1 AAA family ATPase [Paraliomyxa miuraensis]